MQEGVIHGEEKREELIEECGWKEWEHREDKRQGRMVDSAWPAHVAQCSTVPVYSHLFSLGSALVWKTAQYVYSMTQVSAHTHTD